MEVEQINFIMEPEQINMKNIITHCVITQGYKPIPSQAVLQMSGFLSTTGTILNQKCQKGND